jgi:transcription initiation factor TFIIIB Brf1 subunit/transcription initiation factor TFIIB
MTHAVGGSSECGICGSTGSLEELDNVGQVCRSCGGVVAIADEFDSVNFVSAEESEERTWLEFSKVRTSTEAEVRDAFEFIEEFANQLTLPSEVRVRAAEIYADAAVESITARRSGREVVAAIIAVASRELKRPLPNERIAQAANMESARLGQLIRFVQKELDRSTVPNSPAAYVHSLALSLNLDEPTERTARAILREVPGEQTGGCNPGGLAAAALYLGGDGQVTQREVADAAGVTGETIRVRVKDCREALQKARLAESGKTMEVTDG